MHNVLFSIKPQYANLILCGKKTFEFRKIRCKRPFSRMIIYISAPVSRIVGEVYVDSVIQDTPCNIRQITKDRSGLSDKEFDAYFSGKMEAVAYQISNPIKYSNAITIKQIGMTRPPQSYCYLTDYQYKVIAQLAQHP